MYRQLTQMTSFGPCLAGVLATALLGLASPSAPAAPPNLAAAGVSVRIHNAVAAVTDETFMFFVQHTVLAIDGYEGTEVTEKAIDAEANTVTIGLLIPNAVMEAILEQLGYSPTLWYSPIARPTIINETVPFVEDQFEMLRVVSNADAHNATAVSNGLRMDVDLTLTGEPVQLLVAVGTVAGEFAGEPPPVPVRMELYDASSQLLGQQSFELGLSNGIATAQLVVPLEPGSYRVDLLVDPEGLLAESDETDNMFSRDVVPAHFTPPDLRVTSLGAAVESVHCLADADCPILLELVRQMVVARFGEDTKWDFVHVYPWHSQLAGMETLFAPGAPCDVAVVAGFDAGDDRSVRTAQLVESLDGAWYTESVAALTPTEVWATLGLPGIEADTQLAAVGLRLGATTPGRDYCRVAMPVERAAVEGPEPVPELPRRLPIAFSTSLGVARDGAATVRRYIELARGEQALVVGLVPAAPGDPVAVTVDPDDVVPETDESNNQAVLNCPAMGPSRLSFAAAAFTTSTRLPPFSAVAQPEPQLHVIARLRNDGDVPVTLSFAGPQLDFSIDAYRWSEAHPPPPAASSLLVRPGECREWHLQTALAEAAAATAEANPEELRLTVFLADTGFQTVVVAHLEPPDPLPDPAALLDIPVPPPDGSDGPPRGPAIGSLVVAPGGTASFTLRAADPELQSVTVTVSRPPMGGALVSADDRWEYRPRPDFAGEDYAVFSLDDGSNLAPFMQRFAVGPQRCFVNVVPGWNLLSAAVPPLVPLNVALGVVERSAARLWLGRRYGPLDGAAPGQGFWLLSTTTGELAWLGVPVGPAATPLGPGWHLLGTANSRTLPEALAEAPCKGWTPWLGLYPSDGFRQRRGQWLFLDSRADLMLP